MRYHHIYHKIIWIVLLAGLVGLFGPMTAGAFSGITVDMEKMEFVEIDAEVMEVNAKKSYIVIAEIEFKLTTFRIGKKIYQSALLDAKGNIADLKAFKKGQRVVVKGVKISRQDYLAGVIQIKEPGRPVLFDNDFAPKAHSLEPLR